MVKTEAENGIEQKTNGAQQQQVITLNGQQVVVQQPMTLNNTPTAAVQQVVSVRTSNGQIVQVPNGGYQAMQVQAPNTSTVHIPGLGAVQIMNAVPSNQNGAIQFSNGATQIVNAATPQFSSTQSQQALQQDPNDPTKWHVVQVAAAIPNAAPAAPTAQPTQIASSQTTAQIVTANGTVIGSATLPTNATNLPSADGATFSVDTNAVANTANNTGGSNGQPQTKTRLRRVACTCPNCKDGDRGRK